MSGVRTSSVASSTEGPARRGEAHAPSIGPVRPVRTSNLSQVHDGPHRTRRARLEIPAQDERDKKSAAGGQATVAGCRYHPKTSRSPMRSRALTLIAAASMLAVGLVAPTAAATPSSSPALNATIAATSATSSRDKVTSNKKKHKKIEKHVVRLVNKARTKAGLDKVKRRAAI